MGSRNHRPDRVVRDMAPHAERAQQPGSGARRSNGSAGTPGATPAGAGRIIGPCGADPAPADARHCRAPGPRRDLAYGAVVLADVPFWDGTANSKMRPAMVVSVEEGTVVVCPITSNSGWYRQIGAYPRLVFWGEAGLTRPSFLVPYLVSVDRDAVLKVKGRLHDADLQMVRQQHLMPALPPGSRPSPEQP